MNDQGLDGVIGLLLELKMDEKLVAIGAWGSIGDASKIANCMREVARGAGPRKISLVEIEGIGGGMVKSKEKWKQRRWLM